MQANATGRRRFGYRTGAWREIRDEKAFLVRTSWRMAVEQLPRRKGQESHSEAALEELASKACIAVVGSHLLADIKHALMRKASKDVARNIRKKRPKNDNPNQNTEITPVRLSGSGTREDADG